MNQNLGPTPALTDKAAFLRSLAPLFPDVSDTEARLQAIERDLPEREDHRQRHFRAAEEIYFPLWQVLGPAYAATLATPFGSDAARLQVHVEDWPTTLEMQQSRLHGLLEQSRLRQAWRDYAGLLDLAYYRATNRAQQDADQAACRSSYKPLREVPLYMGLMRMACQQLVCLPKAQWQALSNPSLPYLPQQVDETTVERLATRVARVFNTPPLVNVDLLKECGGWDGPVVWTVSSDNLTQPMSGHGMRDCCEVEGWRGDTQPMPADAVAPHWRYEGFYGQLRVTLENGDDWIVAVLAPIHFLRRLSYSVEWFKRFGAPDPQLNS